MSPWLVLALFIGTVLVILLAFQGGLRLGLWRGRRPDPEPALPARTLVASILGLLAFILGFTFDLAESHADARHQSVFQETIALGRAYHLTDQLRDSEGVELRRLIREYVDSRLDANRASTVDIAAVQRLRAYQAEMWARLAAAESNGAASSSLAQVLSEAFDVHGERVLEGFRSRISLRVWLALYVSMLIAVGAAGYIAGLDGAKRSIASVAYALVFSVVIVMIVLGDVPGEAQFQMNRRALSDLRSRLSAP